MLKRRKPKGPPRPVYLYVARTESNDWTVGRVRADVYAEAFGFSRYLDEVINPCHTQARQVFRGVRRGQIKRFAVVPA